MFYPRTHACALKSREHAQTDQHMVVAG